MCLTVIHQGLTLVLLLISHLLLEGSKLFLFQASTKGLVFGGIIFRHHRAHQSIPHR